MLGLSSWFSGIKLKLLVLIAVPVVICLGVIVGQTLIEDSADSYIRNVVLVQSATVFETGQVETGLQKVLKWTDRAVSRLMIDSERTSALQQASDELDRLEKKFERLFVQLKNENRNDESTVIQTQWAPLKSSLRDSFSLMNAFDPRKSKLIADGFHNQVQPAAQAIEQSLIAMNEKQAKAMTGSAEAELTLLRRLQSIIRLGLFAGILFIIGFGVVTARRLAIGVGRVVSEIFEASSEVSSVSSQLYSASQGVSDGSNQSASALEETVASIEELSSMVKITAENAKQTASLSQSSSQIAENGNSEIKTLMESMGQISESSKKIEEIINVIDDIAFQTNLLALNAAVEAARAGEQGKGFAVVAEAVRSLAQRSASAAKDINELIKDSVAKIDRGTKVAGTSAVVLRDIVTSVKKVADLNNEISSASHEQAAGISQISKAMNELDTSTQRNASASQEVALSSDKMAKQSDRLRQLVGDLQTIVTGQTVSSESGRTESVPKARAVSPPTLGPHLKLLRPVAKTNRPAPSLSSQKYVSQAKKAQAGAVESKVKFVPKPVKKKTSSVAAELIPFDDEQPMGKVGTTEGF